MSVPPEESLPESDSDSKKPPADVSESQADSPVEAPESDPDAAAASAAETADKYEPTTEPGAEANKEATAEPVEEKDAEASAAETPAPSASSPGKPAFRVQIGSLGNPEMAREARPKPTPTSPALPKFAQPQSPAEPAEDSAQPADEVEEALKDATAPPQPAPAPKKSYPPPNISRQLTPEMEKELEEALGGMSLDDIIEGKTPSKVGGKELEAESRVTGKVHSVHRDDLFVDLGGQYQGVVSARQFEEVPEIGTELELIVRKFNAEDGLYELSLPGVAVEVADWSEIEEGTTVQAVVTAHNKGGLECTVNNIRAFMPVSQIEIFRVDDLEPYVGQSFPAIVTEANPDRRNLVLSRRALQEREREETRRKKMEDLAVGQTHEGVVRSLQDFGAFVDLGGVDGLIHISQLSWDRVNHPSEVLTLGQKVKVRIEKYDKDSGKIGLSYREQSTNPWNSVSQNYPVGTRHTGKVTKIMQFGAFVRLEPGVEGLIHISEISYQRVQRVTDVLKEGQEVEVQIVSVDMDNQRIGLSMKALEAKPSPVDKAKEEEEKILDELEASAPIKKKHTGPLKGGTSKSSGGEKFGLNW